MYMDSIWPEEDWLKPVGEIKVSLPKNTRASSLYQDHTPGGRNVSKMLVEKLDDPLTQSVASKTFFAEFYSVDCRFFSYQAAIIVARHRKRVLAGGLGVAAILSRHLHEMKAIWNKHSVRFPVEPGSVYGEFWNVEFDPKLELGLITYGLCCENDMLAMFRPANN